MYLPVSGIGDKGQGLITVTKATDTQIKDSVTSIVKDGLRPEEGYVRDDDTAAVRCHNSAT